MFIGSDPSQFGNQFQNVYENALTGPASWGTGGSGFITSTQSGGLVFGIGSDGTLYVDQAYVSGDGFTSFNIWEGESLSSRGFILGRYDYLVSNGETITLNIGSDFIQPNPAAVPLPAGFVLLASALGIAALRRRKRATPPAV
ncbi:MAG: VPLPA-CTERM sorting domain-containing protein [Pseudomonadota bacterium]